MTIVNKKEETILKLYNEDHFESIEEAQASLKEKRKLQEELKIDIELLKDINVDAMRTDAIRSINKVVGISAEQKLNMIDAVNKYYDAFPRTSVYFVGNEGEDHLSHMVVRKSANDPGTQIPLSELAQEDTLFKFFGLNQRTMECFDAYDQMMLINTLLNKAKFQNKIKPTKVLRGKKKVRINHLKEVRSIHSDIYKFIDHLEMLDKLNEVTADDQPDNFNIVLDEKYIYVYFEYKNYEEKYQDGVINAGLCVYNSEVGAGSLQVFAMLNVNNTRFVVKPGNSVYEFREIHKGKDESPAMALENFGNHVDYATNYIVELINRYKRVCHVKVPNPTKTMELVCNRYQVLRSKKVKEKLIEQAEAFDNLTMRDVIHMVAELRLTKKHEDINIRHEFEHCAGDLLNMTDEEILKLL